MRFDNFSGTPMVDAQDHGHSGFDLASCMQNSAAGHAELATVMEIR
jgi:hypothetical protein